VVPRLRVGPFHFVFISWRYKKLITGALAGYTGADHYCVPHLCFGAVEVEAISRCAKLSMRLRLFHRPNLPTRRLILIAGQF